MPGVKITIFKSLKLYVVYFLVFFIFLHARRSCNWRQRSFLPLKMGDAFSVGFLQVWDVVEVSMTVLRNKSF